MNREDITLNHGNPSRSCAARRGSAAAPTSSTQQIALSLRDGVLPHRPPANGPILGDRLATVTSPIMSDSVKCAGQKYGTVSSLLLVKPRIYRRD